MKFILKSVSAALCASLALVAAQAQTIPTPASSAGGGGRAVVAVTPMTASDVTTIVSNTIRDNGIGGGQCGLARLDDRFYSRQFSWRITGDRWGGNGWRTVSTCKGAHLGGSPTTAFTDSSLTSARATPGFLSVACPAGMRAEIIASVGEYHPGGWTDLNTYIPAQVSYTNQVATCMPV